MTEEGQYGIARALMRHPEWRGRLALAAASDDLLADICGSYAAAWRGFEHWSDEDGFWANQHTDEYLTTIEQLEADIEFCLQSTWRH